MELIRSHRIRESQGKYFETVICRIYRLIRDILVYEQLLGLFNVSWAALVLVIL